MLQWNELRITPDNKYLIIDLSVKDNPYFNNVNITGITIDTQDTYISTGPSDNPIYTHELDEPSKSIKLELTSKDLGTTLCGNIFFVYVTTSGEPTEETPCELINKPLMNTVINLYPIYQNLMYFIKEIDCMCSIPKGFIDMVLRLKALELCIKTGNYVQAIKYWKNFFIRENKIPIYNCGCNERTD